MTNKERIENFKLLEKDWNSYGGEPIHLRAIALGIKLCDVLPDKDWFPAPCGDGRIIFEHNTERIGLTIEAWDRKVDNGC